MDATVRSVITGLFFLLIFLSGIGLKRAGRPINVGISTVHKLISLTAGVFLLVTVYQGNRVVPLSANEWTALVIAGLCFAGTVASGGALSFDKPMPAAVSRVHQIAPVLTVLATGATVLQLLGRV